MLGKCGDLMGEEAVVIVNYGNNTVALIGNVYLEVIYFNKLRLRLIDKNGKTHIINWEYVIEVQPLCG